MAVAGSVNPFDLADERGREGRRLIRARRSRITILDRTALVDVAGSAYGPSEAEYRRLLGPL